MSTSNTTNARAFTAYERHRLWVAWVAAAIAIYPILPLRTGAVDILLFSRVVAVHAQISDMLQLYGLVILAALLPVGVFLMWSRPQFVRLGLPRRSWILLGLLLAYAPIQLIFTPQWFGGNEFSQFVKPQVALPVIQTIRQVDKLVLLILTVWAYHRGRTMDATAQLVFHWLLALCFIWALSSILDAGFGYFLQFMIEVADVLFHDPDLKEFFRK